MSDFSGLTALITGAAGGIGMALAEGFAAAGARLALVDIIDASELAARLGHGHRAFTLDLQDPEAISQTVAQIGTEMGLDILINNAGHGVVFPAADPDTSAIAIWDKTQAINLRAPWLMAAAALPFLKRGGRGRVVNIASQAGVIAIAEHAAYGSSKAGLILLTKVLAVEWAQLGVTVNAISPTIVDTPMAEVGWAGEKGVRARQEIPVGRFATPKEVAAAALYLVSADAGIVTGANLMVDGGFTAR